MKRAQRHQEDLDHSLPPGSNMIRTLPQCKSKFQAQWSAPQTRHGCSPETCPREPWECNRVVVFFVGGWLKSRKNHSWGTSVEHTTPLASRMRFPFGQESAAALTTRGSESRGTRAPWLWISGSSIPSRFAFARSSPRRDPPTLVLWSTNGRPTVPDSGPSL